MAKASRSARPAKVPKDATAAEAAEEKRPVDPGGAQPDAALAGEVVSSPATTSTDTAESEDQGGSGDPATPAELTETAADGAQDRYPRFFAASEAWKAEHPGTLPTVVRITSKRDGFRRAGMAHSKASVDHPIGTFDADQLELLLGETNLTVTFA